MTGPARIVLALVVERSTGVPRDRLADIIWPDGRPRRGPRRRAPTSAGCGIWSRPRSAARARRWSPARPATSSRCRQGSSEGRPRRGRRPAGGGPPGAGRRPGSRPGPRHGTRGPAGAPPTRPTGSWADDAAPASPTCCSGPSRWRRRPPPTPETATPPWRSPRRRCSAATARERPPVADGGPGRRRQPGRRAHLPVGRGARWPTSWASIPRPRPRRPSACWGRRRRPAAPPARPPPVPGRGGTAPSGRGPVRGPHGRAGHHGRGLGGR